MWKSSYPEQYSKGSVAFQKLKTSYIFVALVSQFYTLVVAERKRQS